MLEMLLLFVSLLLIFDPEETTLFTLILGLLLLGRLDWDEMIPAVFDAGVRIPGFSLNNFVEVWPNWFPPPTGGAVELAFFLKTKNKY